MQRLTQQLPALLDLVGGHVVQTHVFRVFVVRLGELRVQLLENRVLRPGFAGRARLRELGQPQFEPLVAGVGREQPVQRRGTGAGQAGDEDRPLDRHVGVLRILLPCRLGHQPGHQRVADEEPAHLAAELGEVGVALIGLQQHAERFAVVVVVGAEIIEADRLGGRCVQVLDGADIGADAHGPPPTRSGRRSFRAAIRTPARLRTIRLCTPRS